MKKKIAFVCLTIVLAMVLSATLVCCTPSRPDLFIQEILASERWGVFITNKNGDAIETIARNGDVHFDGVKTKHFYRRLTKTGVEQFTYTISSESWSFTFFKDGDAGTAEVKKIITDSTANITTNGAPDISSIMVDFNNKYERRDGKWYERNTQPASLYVKGNKLIYEKNNLIVTYVLGYKFKIPSEAFDAME